MTIATATSDGRPSARVVLLRGFDERGLVFYTNYDSRKAEELEANPYAAALFYWPQLDRQIRAEGPGHQGRCAEESEAYFAARPAGRSDRRVGVAAERADRRPARSCSRCSTTPRRASRTASVDVPLPPFWGGYRLVPEVFEFWVNRRVGSTTASATGGPPSKGVTGPWVIDRLAP